jgi:hypothetical protein
MRTRHLALVLLEALWYMLSPPVGAGGHIETSAPLARWHRGFAFSAQGSCLNELQSEILRAGSNPATSPGSLALLKASICIEGDDSRLGSAADKSSD